jgi:hypothetical protein
MKYLSLFIYLFILVTLTNCQKSQDATNPDITTDLVAYYPFSGNALDSSGNGFHGTLLGVISTTDRSGKSNSAFRFIGNIKIGIPALTPLNNAQKLTFSFWKRTTAVVNNYTRSMNVLNFGGKFVFNMGTMPLYKRDTIFIANNQAYMAGSVKNDVGSWNHYAITYDASKKTCDVYYNGKFASTDYLYSNRTDNFLFPVLSSADQCSIGPSMGSSPTEFDELDEIRVFKRVLTADQIAFLATR